MARRSPGLVSHIAASERALTVLTNDDQCVRVVRKWLPDDVFTNSNTIDVFVFCVRRSDRSCSINLAQKYSSSLRLMVIDALRQEFIISYIVRTHRSETPITSWQSCPYTVDGDLGSLKRFRRKVIWQEVGRSRSPTWPHARSGSRSLALYVKRHPQRLLLICLY